MKIGQIKVKVLLLHAGRQKYSCRFTGHCHDPEEIPGRLQLKCDSTRRRTGGEVKGKLMYGVGSQYSSHYLGTWCIQHYYG
jgi:hypothetical protein